MMALMTPDGDGMATLYDKQRRKIPLSIRLRYLKLLVSSRICEY